MLIWKLISATNTFAIICGGIIVLEVILYIVGMLAIGVYKIHRKIKNRRNK